MKKFDFNNKTFLLVENSEKGQVNSETIFKYKQDGNLVTADYYGGSVKSGKIIARLDGDKLEMVYNCITSDGDLKAGKAIADVSLNEHGKIKLKLNWEWLDKSGEKGTSEYLEN